MESLAEYIRRIGADVNPEKLQLRKIKIFFKAPVLKEAPEEALTKEDDTSQEANFQWVQYSIIFSKGEQYYLFRSPIDPSGSKLTGGEVFKSDSRGENLEKSDITKNEVLTAFPEILKGEPKLVYKSPDAVGIKNKTNLKEDDVTYYNQVGGGIDDYSVEEFGKTFFQDYYIVFSVSKEKKRPDGRPVKLVHDKEPEEEKVETP